MAEQIITSATSAVTGELTRILFSGLVGRLETRQAAADDDKKLRRLELLLIKVHSAVEASEKHPIENAWLVKWRDKFKEAAAEGDEVLAGFGQPATNSAPAAGDAQQQEHPSPAASAPPTTTGAASSSARNAPSSGMVYGIRGASSEDIERMNSAVEKLEELSPEIGDFIKLLKVEVLALRSKHTKKRPRGTGTRKMSLHSRSYSMWTASEWSDPSVCNSIPIAREAQKKASVTSMNLSMPTETRTVMNQTATEEEEERTTLSDRLEKAYATICRTVDLADGRDLRGHEWLARWGSILKEAMEQGHAVLDGISARRGGGAGAVDDNAGAACEQAAECDGDREEDPEFSELGRFVWGMENLAGEVDYFVGLLACLCPSY
ncbi:unnamed protein product [Urochloa humidicola]